MTRFVLIFALLLTMGLPKRGHSAWPVDALFTRCAELLRGTDWLEAYQQARTQNDARGGAIALAQLIADNGETWRLHPDSQAHFKRAAQILRLRAVHVDGKRPAATQGYQDRRNRIDRIRDWGKDWGKELLWASAPFLFRVPYLMQQNVKFREFFYSPRYFLHQYQLSLLALGIADDSYFRRVIRTLFPVSAYEWEQRLSTASTGAFLYPFGISVILMMHQLHPMQFVADAVTESPYGLTDYLRDTEQKAAVQWEGKRISLLVDRGFLENLPHSDIDQNGDTLESDPLHGVAEFNMIRRIAHSVHEATIGSPAELNAELQKAAKSDITIIVAHGSPGDFVLNDGEQRYSITEAGDFSPVVFTQPNPVIIFVSCDFGDKPSENKNAPERWKQISDQVFAATGGRSFAAINPVTFHRVLENGAIPAGADPNGLRRALSSTITQAAGLVWIRLYFSAVDRASTHYGFARGMREYRASSGETLFHEADSFEEGAADRSPAAPSE